MQLLTYVNFPVLITLAAVADPLIPFLLSPKWNQTIPFFQMLVFIGMMQPLKSQFINILKVEAKGKQLIRFVLWSKLFYIMGIILTLNMGLYALVASQVIANGCELFIFCMVGKEIGYLKSDFLKDIMPNLGLALSTGGLLYTINALTSLPPFWALVMDLFVGVATYLILSFLTKNPSFMEIKKEVTSKFAK
jgi:O-antigen/teichoic acid export membrane protein